MVSEREIHTPNNCTAAVCGRLHIHDVVRVVGSVSQVGYMQYGEVIDQPTANGFTIHFPDGVPVLHEGRVLDIMNDLTYSESELEKIST